MKILVYDVETANLMDIGSICSVGWILLDNDEEIDSGYSLINPKCLFSKKNISIHGITRDDVADAPCFRDYWENTLGEVMSSSLVLAHSAGFDLSATEQALFRSGLEDPGIDYVDTLDLIRAILPGLPSYKLMDLANMMHYEYEAHNALNDVQALLHVLLSIRDITRLEDLASLLLHCGAKVENTKRNRYNPHEIREIGSYADRKARCREDVQKEDSALEGLRICVTGDFDGYSRADIERIILQHGGRMTSSVSKMTDYLVVGTYADYGPGYVSGKQKTALQLIESGEKVKIINQAEFFGLLSC